MKVLITGASGFLGRSFLEWFMIDGQHDVWSVDLRPHPDGVPIDVQDMCDYLHEFDEDVDLVVHMASPVGGRMKIDLDPMYNADAFRLDSEMFRWAVKHADTVIYPSSSAVYPIALQEADSQGKLSELRVDPTLDVWGRPDQIYGLSKLVGENLAWRSAAYGLNTLCIRPFSGYGPGQDFDYPVPSIAARILKREDPIVVWGPGSQQRDFVYVTDIVKATMERLTDGVTGYRSMNICSGWGWSFNDIAMAMAEIEGYRPQIVNDPTKPVGVMRRIGDPTVMRRYYKLEVTVRDGLKRVLEDVRGRL